MADTDGDGYSDGDEINSGYNPKAAGKVKDNFENKIMCEDIKQSNLRNLCNFNSPENYIDLLNCNLLQGQKELYEYCLEKQKELY